MRQSGMSDRSPTVLITGAASGIGRASAARLADDGVRVLGLDLKSPAETDAFSAFRQADVTDANAMAAAIDEMVAEAGGLTGLVHCAGMSLHGTIMETGPADWDKVVALNLTSVFHVIRCVIPHLQEHGGAIVTIGSTFGLMGRDGMTGYAATKAAAIHLTKCVAIDYAADGIRANCVCPGLIDTPMTAYLNSPEGQAKRRSQVGAHPMKRMGTAEEVAATISYLLSDDARFVTGQAIAVDGGYTAGKQVLTS